MSKIIPFQKKEPQCVFYKRKKSQVRLLIGSKDSPHICSDCVAKCKKLLEEE